MTESYTAESDTQSSVPTTAIIEAMLDAGTGISDLIFSPGRPPQVELHGRLTAVSIPALPILRATDTAQICADLIGTNEHARRTLAADGACDLSYSLPQRGRFRVNIFRQRGTHAIVMRVIAARIPTMEELKLPPVLGEIAGVKNGIVLVTGPTGSGKSSTLAAMIDRVNSTRAEHIVTIEDPIEFLHDHKMGTVHQRELHSDTPSFAQALRAALRQAPKVILVGEMRDRDTIEVAMTAAETGHLVLSTLHTIDASKTVERVVGAFDAAEQQTIRARLAASFRCFVSQRFVRTVDGGRVAVFEILRSTLRTREYVERGESEGRSLLDAMRDGEIDGMQHFDGEIETLIRSGVVSMESGLLSATNPGNLRVQLADVPDEPAPAPADDPFASMLER
jgi:twitching motility protein PilT